MSNCPNCGSSRSEHSLACPLCGYKPRLASAAGSSAAAQEPSPSGRPAVEERQNVLPTPREPSEESMREVLAEAKKRKSLRSKIKKAINPR